jgi:hypothetical protein
MAKLLLAFLPLFSMVNFALAAYPNIYAAAAPAEQDPRPIHPSLIVDMRGVQLSGEDDGATTSGPQEMMMSNINPGERSAGGTTDNCSTATGFATTTDDEHCARYVRLI